MFSNTQCLGSNSTTFENGQPYFPYSFPVPAYASSSVSTQIFSLPFSSTTTPTQDSTGNKTITASTSPAVSIVADSTLPTGQNAFCTGTLSCSNVTGISNGNWSISFWANLASTDTVNYFYLLNSSTSTFYIRCKRNDTSSTNQYLRVANKYKILDSYSTMSTSTISSNVWNFYTITCTSTQMVMFINGSQVKTVTSPYSYYDPPSTFSFSGSSSTTFPCQLSGITIYNSTLTQNQVYNLLFPSPTLFLPFNSTITPTKDSSSGSLALAVSGVSIVLGNNLRFRSPSLYSFNRGAILCNTIPVSTLGGWSCSFWIKMNPTSSSTNTYVLNSETSDYRLYVIKNSTNSSPVVIFEVKYTDDSGYLTNSVNISSSNTWYFFTFSTTSTTTTTFNSNNNNTLTVTAATGKILKSPSANMLFTASDICNLSNITIFNSYLAYGQVQNLYTVAQL
jgi:Concanavalin A-like lectin/glucanases superfamily